MLTKEEIGNIHNATIDLLENIGVNVASEKIQSITSDKGAIIDPETGLTKFPEYLVNEHLKSVPSSFKLYGPFDNSAVSISKEASVFATQGAPTEITDETDINRTRAAKLSDLTNFLRIVDSLDNIDCSHLDLWPTDIPYTSMHCYAIKEWMQNNKKPFGLGVRGEQYCLDAINLISILLESEDEIIKKPRLIGFFNPISPLTLPRVLLGGLYTFAKYKQPLIIAPAATGGLNAPITLAGLLTQVNAEILSSVVITQLVNKGAPVLYGNVNTPMDPKTGNVAWGAIETGLIAIAAAQLSDYYNIPSRSSGSITNALSFGMQNGYERFMTLLSTAFSGINYITCAGTYANGLALSLELLIIDNELIGMAKRALMGIKVDKSSIALEEIKKIASGLKEGKNYLQLRHTAKNVRNELYISELAERNNRDTWIRKGSKEIFSKAREKKVEILQTYQVHKLDSGIEAEIDDYIARVEKANKNEYLENS